MAHSTRRRKRFFERAFLKTFRLQSRMETLASPSLYGPETRTLEKPSKHAPNTLGNIRGYKGYRDHAK